METEKTNSQSFENVYNPGDLLTFTLNPNEHYQCFGQQNRFNNVRNRLNREFMESMPADSIPYWAKLELSEPINEIKSPGSRIHMHGFMLLKDAEAVFLFLQDIQCFLSQIGILKINHCRSQSQIDGWVRYIEVQRPIFKNKCRLISSIMDSDFPKSIFKNLTGSPSGETDLCLSPDRGATSSPPPRRGKGGRKGVKGGDQQTE